MASFFIILFAFLAACSYDYAIVTPSSNDPAVEDTAVTVVEDVDGDGFTVEDGDCDDENAAVNPSSIEVCNGIDDNCDGDIDNDAVNRTTIYFDADGDGHAFDYENATATICLLDGDDLPPNYCLTADDCDDTNPSIYPGAEEVCDEFDNDCDGQMNEGLTWRWVYTDDDGDGYGNNSETSSTCDDTLPTEYETWVWDNTDCNDDNSAVHPGAEEVCDWIPDNNCDGVLDTAEIDGVYDGNGDGDYDDPGDTYETNGPDGSTVCFPYHTQNDTDGDRYCSTGYDANGDGDYTDVGDIMYPNDGTCPEEYKDCNVTDADIYPGHGC